MTSMARSWLDNSFLETAFDNDMPEGAQLGTARVIDFVGPLMLGALIWEIVAVDLSSLLSFTSDYIMRRRSIDRKQGYMAISVSTLSISSRLSALAFICVYLVFTQGQQASNCNVWPIIMVALGALSISLALGAALLRSFAFSPTRLSKVFLISLWFTTVVTTFSSIATWKGDHLQSFSCQFQVDSVFGFFYLGPFVTLLLAVVVLMTCSTSTLSCTSHSKRKQSIQHGEAEMVGGKVSLIKTLRSRVLRSKDDISQSTTSSPRTSSTSSEELGREGNDETVNPNSFDEVHCDQLDILRHCLAWWMVLLAILLIGCFLAFANNSTLLILTYYPISIVLFVLFMARVCFPIKHHNCLEVANLPPTNNDNVGLEDSEKQDKQHFEKDHQVNSRSSSSRSPNLTFVEQKQTQPQHPRIDRRGPPMYHIRGNSLRDQINRIAQSGNASRISEDVMKSEIIAGEVVLHKLDEESVNACELREDGMLGLINDNTSHSKSTTTPNVQAHEESSSQSLFVSSASPELSTPLSPTPRRRILKDEETSSSEVMSPECLLKRSSQDSKTTDSPALDDVAQESESASSPFNLDYSLVSSPENHQEVIQDTSSEIVECRRSISPRSLGSSMGYVSACNEPWQANNFARRSSVVLLGTKDMTESDEIE